MSYKPILLTLCLLIICSALLGQDGPVPTPTPALATITKDKRFDANDVTLYAKNEIDRDTTTSDGKIYIIGSSPLVINFKVLPDSAKYIRWVFASDPEIRQITRTYNEREFELILPDAGKTYVKLHIEFDKGSKDSTEVCTIEATVSDLKVPNIFTPGVSPGINDEFRVAYKSIVTYKINIFNRWGVLVYNGDDPGRGWDGYYQGKLVPPGAYIYFIEAEGSDKVRYSLKGTLTIYKNK